MPWHKGQSGNPGGLSKGSRHKLTDAFIRALARDFEAHGEKAIQRVRVENPIAYFKGMLSLVQKDVSLEGQINPMPFDTSMSATIALLDSIKSECVDSRVNDNNDEPQAKVLTKKRSATSA